ncbi:MAG: ABC transporter permease [Deltaproteobacteria bacterium]|jgi:putative ABC transport system permease protein|nr:ABC transporter permease [Deltaproteobacteria bacterium]
MNNAELYTRALLSNAFKQAWMAVLAFRLRSFFVILAVSLGIAALTVIVASLEGANRKIEELVSSFGPDAAFVSGGSVISRAVGQRSKTITWKDVNTMRDSLPGVYITAPISFKGESLVVYESRNFQVSRVMGSTENYARIWDWPLSEGRDISAEDLSRGADVCLVGGAVARELFGTDNAIGKTVLISKVPFTIVGKLSERGASGSGGNMDETVIMPLSTMIQRFNQDRQYLRMVRLKFLDAANMDMHANNIRTLLRYLHGLDEDTPDDFTIITALDIQRFISMIKGGMSVFLGITALAAVCVSGFVLANLFYISVSERSMEVGLKKALGAPRSAITAQFLCEAVLLTLGGSFLGLLWGALFSLTLTNTLFRIELSWTVFLYSVVAAVLIGVIFGLKPAHRAAGMEPISALKGAADNG